MSPRRPFLPAPLPHAERQARSNRLKNISATKCFVVAILVLKVTPAIGGDWPQILGPHRNGIANDEEVRTDWQGERPPTMWSYAVGQGYAGPAIAGDRVIVFHRRGDREIVDALDARTGKRQWSQSWSSRYQSRIDPDAGPRCVPLIDGSFVYLHGAAGRLVCLSVRDGQQQWYRDTRLDFAAPDGYFGAGSSPLVVGDKLVVNIGGQDQCGVVAFAKDSGETVWTALDDEASYSSPILATVDGAERILR